jgi:PAS domain S-box-containing protein
MRDERKTKAQLIEELKEARGKLQEKRRAAPRAQTSIPADSPDPARVFRDLGLSSDILDQIHDLLVVTNAEGRIIYVNRAASRALGYESRELIGRTVKDFGEDPGQGATQGEIVEQTLRNGYWRGEVVNIRRDGESRLMECVTTAIRDKAGRVVAMVGASRDITERRAAAEAQRESEERYRRLVEFSEDMIFSVDRSGVFLTAGGKRLGEYGLSPENIIGKSLAEIFGEEDAAAYQEPHARVFESGQALSYEHTFEFNGINRADWTVVYPIRDSSGNVCEVGVLCRDITKRKRADERIQATLREKEVLISEIHHRVKNNLQIICSLLRLQEGKVSDPRVREMFRESRSRIFSMAGVHDQLYRSGDLAHIDFDAYLFRLLDHQVANCGVPDRGIRLERNLEPLTLDIHQAIPCGLIVNELVSNAYKHAFPREGGGRIQIRLRRDTMGRIELTVFDNGIGFPEKIDIEKPTTLGLQLVCDLARQLQADTRVERRKGTRFTVLFRPAP